MPQTRNVPAWLIERPIAHRGLHDNHTVPENSLRAFSAAMSAELPIELDVHLLADGQLVVFHDHNLARMTGVDDRVANQNSRTIGNMRLLQTDQGIPLLTEVLRLVDGCVPLLIEIKTMRLGVGKLENAVLCALEDYHGLFAVQSFNVLSVNYFRRHAASVCRGQLSGGHAGMPLSWLTEPDFVAYDVDSLQSRFATHVRRTGVALLAWTVRNDRQYKKAVALADNYIFERTPDFTVPLPEFRQEL